MPHPSKHARLAALCLACLLPAAAGRAVEFWVAPAGTSRADGARANPFASPAAALEKVGALRRLGQLPPGEPVRIFLREGIYPLTGPLSFQSPAASGTTGPIQLTAAPAEHPVLSGGVRLAGWHPLRENLSGLPPSAREKVWVADAPKIAGRILEFRQLWVNDQKASRAREPNGDQLTRLVAWDKPNQVATIPATALAGIKQPAGLEMVVAQVWEIAGLRVQSIRRNVWRPFRTSAASFTSTPNVGGSCNDNLRNGARCAGLKTTPTAKMAA